MKVQPLDDRVLVEPLEEEEKVGSIIIPDTAKEKPVIGKVVAVGTDKEIKELIKVGDKVVFEVIEPMKRYRLRAISNL